MDHSEHDNKDEDDEADDMDARSNPEWRWGDEDPDVSEPTEPMLDDETAKLVAEAELMLATGRTLNDIEEAFKRGRVVGGEEGDAECGESEPNEPGKDEET